MEQLSKTDIQSILNSRTDSIRLNKYLSDSGLCSRREADRMIEAGRIMVDGKKAVLGQKVYPDQEILADGKSVVFEDKLVLLAFHKPAGIECTTSPDISNNIIDYIHYPSRIFPIGRLDRNSSGLILLTNTGDISDRILKGSNYHEKEYEVMVDRDITWHFLQKMQDGVEIELEDGKKKVRTRPCQIAAMAHNSFHIILTQGLNRQIRRMCEALGYHVISLKRIRIINILLNDLPEGQYRDVTEEELKELLKQL